MVGFRVGAEAEMMGVARSHLHDEMRPSPKPRGPYRKTDDDALVQLVRRQVDERPTYGYRRITPLANRELTRAGSPPVDQKRLPRRWWTQTYVIDSLPVIARGGVHQHPVRDLGNII